MRRRPAALAGLVVAVLAAGPAGPAGAADAAAAGVRIDVLSSRADLVSGGDALVRITVPRRGDARRLRVHLGRRDVTRRFARRANGRIEGLLRGIPNGRSTLTARVPGRGGARLALTGHPNGGPLVSGPQLQPWTCQRGAVDRQCNQPARYALKALTRRGLVAYDRRSPPAGIRTARTTDGRRVPFVVRVETGYQNRDQYRIATLFDPRRPWRPWAPQRGWNRRVVFVHGQSCGTDRRAGIAPDVLDLELLGKGFMLVSTALANLGHNCNPVIVAESELMARERVIERYGPVRATLGTGCSGGSIAQLAVAHAYPGFYDGVTIQCAFADLFTTSKHAVAGHLLRDVFARAAAGGGPRYTAVDQALVGGSPLASIDDLLFDVAFWPFIDGARGCAGLGPRVVRWSPRTPAGVRCGVLDHNVNVLGRGSSGHAGVPFDNVGVQYGLQALRRGRLSPAKFVDLNARIGGLDKLTLAPTPERTEADPQALRNAYRSGYLAIGNTLGHTPILEGRGSGELTAHATYPTLVLNARLERHAGSHASHVTWQGPVPVLGGRDYTARLVLAMDRWVARIRRDRRTVSRLRRIRDARPADVRDRCELPDGRIVPGLDCPQVVRFHQSPTQAAGESVRNDVLKCALKPLRREDHAVTFTDAEWATLTRTFPSGVCDWSRPGVGEAPTVPWLTYRDGPGGRPLGPAPRSRALPRR